MNNDLEQVINDCSSIIYYYIGKYGKYTDKDDLYQAAIIGIIKAYKNFDIQYQTKFSTYASSYIKGEIYDFLIKNRTIKLSNDWVIMAKKISQTKQYLEQAYMRVVSNQEIANFLEIPLAKIEEILISNQMIDSLDRELLNNDSSTNISNVVGFDDWEAQLNSLWLDAELNKLNEFEKKLLWKRYYEDQTQSQTASTLGINQVKVSRNEQKILKKIKENTVL